MSELADLNYDPALFEIDIVKLHEDAIKTLDAYVVDFNDTEKASIEAYANGVLDQLCERNECKNIVFTIDGVKELIEEMWQKDNAIIEDMAYRRAFILICKMVEIVRCWCQYRLDYEEDMRCEE